MPDAPAQNKTARGLGKVSTVVGSRKQRAQFRQMLEHASLSRRGEEKEKTTSNMLSDQRITSLIELFSGN
jgi:hypothetical protein